MPPKSFQGFSLVELLAVISIMSLLLGFSVPVTMNAIDTNRFDQSLLSIITTLERCHSYAMANQTYVYVGMLDSEDGEVSLAAVASSSGIDVTDDWTDAITNFSASDTGVIPIGKVTKLSQIHLETGSQISGDRVSRPIATPIDISSSPVTFGIISSKTFPIILRFNPDGSVSRNAITNTSLEFGIQAAHRPNNVAVIQVAGLTGITKAYQP